MSFLRFVSFAAVVLACPGSALAEIITPNQAIAHVGEQVTVEGVLEQVSEIDSGTIFLNYGGRYPDHIFYGVIFGDNAGAFPDLSALEGNIVALSGTIQLHKGKPQIILTDPSQIVPRYDRRPLSKLRAPNVELSEDLRSVHRAGFTNLWASRMGCTTESKTMNERSLISRNAGRTWS